MQGQAKIHIIGAGPAGASAALFLAKHGIASVIIDKASFPRDKVCGDACSGKVAWVLKKLDIPNWQEFISKNDSLASWGVKFYGTKNNELRVPFKLNYKAEAELAPGFIAKRIDFDNYLISLVKKESLIELVENCSISYFRREGKTVFFGNDKLNKHFQSDIILAADGAYSYAAKCLMSSSPLEENNALGLRAYYKGVKGLDKDGFIELHFLEELLPGYFWIFPLANGEANVGLGMKSDLVKKKRINLKELFEKVVKEHPTFKDRFEHAELIDPMKLHGLPLGGHKNISDDNILLLGDAAALIDPFTGEGIGNAMISGMLAAELLIDLVPDRNFSKEALVAYDKLVYRRLANELKLSKKMQDLTSYPWLFNFIVNKARGNKELRETISCMFENVDLRKKLSNPLFYLRVLFGS
ncbi:MAG: geranylgeranyl reductase family protein [Chitinophagales bacterium]|nr:geranylgeranyl reductase family protein [Chitinophagales bacterium]